MNWDDSSARKLGGPTDIPTDRIPVLGRSIQSLLSPLVDLAPTCHDQTHHVHRVISSILGDVLHMHRAKLYSFGSGVVYGISEKGSDLDLVQLSEDEVGGCQTDPDTPQAKMDQNHILSTAARLLKSAQVHVTEYPRARVPFLRCQTPNGQVDISACRRNGVRNSLLLQHYIARSCIVPVSSAHRWLALAVKVWAKRSSLIDPNQAYLSTYAFNLLVSYFLIRRQRVPFVPVDAPAFTLHATETPTVPQYIPMEHVDDLELGSLVRDFLNFYNHEFNYVEHVISLSRPETTTKLQLNWTQAGEEHARTLGAASGTTAWYRLAIEDPYEHNLNVGRFVTPLRYGLLRTALHSAYANGLGYFH